MLQLFLTFCHLEAKAFITVTVVGPFHFSEMKHLFVAPRSHGFVEKVFFAQGKNPLGTGLLQWFALHGLDLQVLMDLQSLTTSVSSPYFSSVGSVYFVVFSFLDLFIYYLFYHLYFM